AASDISGKTDAGRLEQQVQVPYRYSQGGSRAGGRQAGFGEMLVDIALCRFELRRSQRGPPAPPPLVRGSAGQRRQSTQVRQNRIADVWREVRELRNRPGEGDAQQRTERCASRYCDRDG